MPRTAPAERDRWQIVCDADPDCTFFQTPVWVRLMTELEPGAADGSVHLTMDDGIEMVVPRVVRPLAGGLFLAAESVPVGAYGAPVTVGGGLARRSLREVGRLYRGFRMGPSVLVEAPGSPLDLGLARSETATHILALTGVGDEQALLGRYRKGHRADVARAKREEIQVRAAAGPDDVDAYYRIYMETVGRWHTGPFRIYPRSLFQALAELSLARAQVRLWVALREERIVAGIVVVAQGRHAAYWHAASTEEGRRYGAGHLALHHAILHTLILGVERFDFMRSPGLDAVARFKAGFGATEESVGIHTSPGGLGYRVASGLRRGLRRRR